MADIKRLLKNVEENVSLAKYTSFKIGGPARYFYVAKNAEDIRGAVQVAKDLKLPYYILGGGNNILVSDQGFNGLVIKVKNQDIKITDNEISAGAGAVLANLVSEAANAGLKGMEWMAGIPGTFGGAIYGNAGAFDGSIGKMIKKVEVLDPDDLTVKKMKHSECEFAYRDSVFKRNKYIILSAVLELERGNQFDIQDLIKEHIKKRGSHSAGFPNAGSVFKNVLIAENKKVFNRLIKKFPELEKFKAKGKIPAGWFVEELGLRGKKIGGAMIAEKHGNFILNTGDAKATDIVMLTSLIKQKVRVNFGLQLEEEIQYVGF